MQRFLSLLSERTIYSARNIGERNIYCKQEKLHLASITKVLMMYVCVFKQAKKV